MQLRKPQYSNEGPQKPSRIKDLKLKQAIQYANDCINFCKANADQATTDRQQAYWTNKQNELELFLETEKDNLMNGIIPIRDFIDFCAAKVIIQEDF